MNQDDRPQAEEGENADEGGDNHVSLYGYRKRSRRMLLRGGASTAPLR
ncbi:MAG: hypothetical protein KZQ79_02870 [Candidatus Thiodiazotropha sp. (ex Lucinoma borealis)]|nr:hypothetical protein [Candidatus Thiodiazotropha sp. (ex Lucinoma borealis)]